MKVHRFFVHEFIERPLESSLDGEVIITHSGLIHQLKDVFRMEAGSDVILLDNTGSEFLSNISEISKERVRFHIAEVKKCENIPRREVTLCAALIKKDKFEWVLEKGTELGITQFVPIQTERSEKKNLNMERAKKIIQEAAEQSERGKLPELFEISNLEDVIAKFDRKFFALGPSGENFDKNFVSQENAWVFIGPEGGWSDNEIEFFKNKNIPIYSLGKQILRAETASIAVASILLL